MTHSPALPLRICAAVALLGFLAGCGSSGPRVYPVEGKIVFKGKAANMRQLIGGRVRFQSTTDPKVTPVGSIEDDGVFSMGTMADEKSLPGVPAGTYKARIELPRTNDEDEERRPAPIPAKYLDFDKSGLVFNVPTQGEIVIEVERR